jgi:hypothetical protein
MQVIAWGDDAHLADLPAAQAPAPGADIAERLQAPIAPASPSAR